MWRLTFYNYVQVMWTGDMSGRASQMVAVAIIALSFCRYLVAHGTAEIPPLPSFSESTLAGFDSSTREQIRSAAHAAQSDPQDAQAAGRLGMILHAYGKHRLAEICYQRAHLLDSGDFRWVYYLAVVRQQLGQYEQAVERKPGFLPARIRLAESLLAVGDLEGSRTFYQNILRETPDLALAYFGLAQVLSASGDLKAAVKNYQKACEVSPDFGAAHYALALRYRDLGRTEEARKEFLLYQSHKDTRPPLVDALMDSLQTLEVGAVSHFNEARKLEKLGMAQEAVKEYERALALDSELTQAHVNLVSLYATLGDIEQAEAHYKTALKVNPNLAELHYNFGLLQNHREKYEEAAGAFRKALELNPFFADAHNNLGSLLEREGKLDQAERHFRLALENNPGHRLAHFSLGRLLRQRGKYQEAIDHFLKTLTEEDEKTSTFLYFLADTCVRAGDVAAGTRFLKQAIERAKKLGQTDLAARMERDLADLEQRSP